MSKDKTKIKKLKDKERFTYSNIIKDDDPLLRDVSFDVPYPLSNDDKKLMNKIIDYVRSSQDDVEAKKRGLRPAYGLSAIQVGVPKKLMYIRIQNEYNNIHEEFALVNANITYLSPQKAYLSDGEECLSVTKKHEGYVYRSNHIRIVGIDMFTDREVEIESRGLTAIVFQHEFDHFKGILYYDRINPLDKFYKVEKAIKI